MVMPVLLGSDILRWVALEVERIVRSLEKRFFAIIRASSLSPIVKTVSGFGYSIAQRLNAREENKYEIAIGAYDSDLVTVFKTKDMFVLDWNMTFTGRMDLTQRNCNFIGTKPGQYACVTTNVCLLYKMSRKTSSSLTLSKETIHEIYFTYHAKYYS
ncbi:hypothetical protein SK128_009669 [Halocaridina rubra]|uniref:Uncharacterized protein n=1 Tax=Halocaridina rubra TaxID=373956 RepID=A0AAN9A5G9_HALRR